MPFKIGKIKSKLKMKSEKGKMESLEEKVRKIREEIMHMRDEDLVKYGDLASYILFGYLHGDRNLIEEVRYYINSRDPLIHDADWFRPIRIQQSFVDKLIYFINILREIQRRENIDEFTKEYAVELLEKIRAHYLKKDK